MIKYTKILSILLLGLLISLAACQTDRTANEKSQKVRVLATTNIIYDALTNVCNEQIELDYIMGAGVDPHVYKPKKSDLDKMRDADIIIYNGLHLEGKVIELFDKMEQQGKQVFAMGESVDNARLVYLEEGNTAAVDPHVWFDIPLWSAMLQNTCDYLDRTAKTYNDAASADCRSYLEQLKTLGDEVQLELEKIDTNKRILITTHDAFNYLGRSTSLQVEGVQGISTASEVGLKDIKNTVDLIIANDINAVFGESAVSNKELQAIKTSVESAGKTLEIKGVLYADALGEPDGEAGTYIKMMRHNLKIIKEGLSL